MYINASQNIPAPNVTNSLAETRFHIVQLHETYWRFLTVVNRFLHFYALHYHQLKLTSQVSLQPVQTVYHNNNMDLNQHILVLINLVQRI